MKKHILHRIMVLLYTVTYTFVLCSFDTVKIRAYDPVDEETGYLYSESVLNSIPEPSTIAQMLKVEEPIEEEVVEEPEEEVVEPAIEVIEEDPIPYINVPLSVDLQNHIVALCEERNIDPAIILAMIYRESRFTADAVGDNGNSLGLMQIQPRWHQARMEKLGCTDLLNPYHNVSVGIDLLGDLFESSGSIEWALMAYNGGSGYANDKVSRGEVSDYVISVLNNSERISKGEKL